MSMGRSISELKMGLPQATYSRERLLWMSTLSTLAAIGCVVADLILQYDPQGNYSLATPAPVTIALWRVLAGSLLGVFCIPFEIVGYWVVCTILAKTSPRLFRALFWVMGYGIVIGTVFHAMSMAVILVGQAAHNASSAAQTSLLNLQNTLLVFSVPLGVFFEVCYLVIWSIVIITILRNSTWYPKWIVLFVPVVGSLVIAGIGQSHVLPVLGNILYPTVTSLPHLVFFFVSTVLAYNHGKMG